MYTGPNDCFQLEVLVNGRSVKEYPQLGKVFIEGRKGSEFTIRVHNHSSRRAVAVISVDGLSVMDGKTASTDGVGYILEPHGFTDVPGWRLDDDEVARFFFSSLPEAYAAKMDKPANIGVIGTAFFFEKEQSPMIHKHHERDDHDYPWMPVIPPRRRRRRRPMPGDPHDPYYADGDEGFFDLPVDPPDPYPDGDEGFFRLSGGPPERSTRLSDSGMSDALLSASSFADSSTSKGLGTGFGKRTGHKVVSVAFARETDPAGVAELRYDDAEGLIAAGVVLDTANTRLIDAESFPGDKAIGAEPPPDWEG